MFTLSRHAETQCDLCSKSLDFSCTANVPEQRKRRSQTATSQNTTKTHTHTTKAHTVPQRRVLFSGLFTLACRLLSLPFLVKMSAPSFSLPLSVFLYAPVQLKQDSYGKQCKQTHPVTQSCQVSCSWWVCRLGVTLPGVTICGTKKEIRGVSIDSLFPAWVFWPGAEHKVTAQTAELTFCQLFLLPIQNPWLHNTWNSQKKICLIQ